MILQIVKSSYEIMGVYCMGLNVLYSNIDNIAHVKNTYQYNNESDISAVFNEAIVTPCLEYYL
jgi:teichuronic acid biosynthesis glycosyltransferase TuaH